MSNEQWLADLFEENYALLYRVGRMFQCTSMKEVDTIEDQIQETFILAWRHERKLKVHPNQIGWLVETFRRCMMAQGRKLRKEWIRHAFSMDQEGQSAMEDRTTLSAESFVQGAEQVAMLHQLFGDRNADLFKRYCLHGESAKQLAQDFQMSETTVRVRVSRLKKKLLNHKEMFLCVVVLLAIGLKMGGSL